MLLLQLKNFVTLLCPRPCDVRPSSSTSPSSRCPFLSPFRFARTRPARAQLGRRSKTHCSRARPPPSGQALSRGFPRQTLGAGERSVQERQLRNCRTWCRVIERRVLSDGLRFPRDLPSSPPSFRIISVDSKSQTSLPSIFSISLRLCRCQFQKRGLPHALWMATTSPSPRTTTVRVRGTPDPDRQPRLFHRVVSSMVRGPCGGTCQRGGVCSKS